MSDDNKASASASAQNATVITVSQAQAILDEARAAEEASFPQRRLAAFKARKQKLLDQIAYIDQDIAAAEADVKAAVAAKES